MKISIIGGGITGLTTALALRKVGLASIVHERAAELNEVGAGILMQPNALKILDWLGIKNQLLEAGTELDRMEITDSSLKPFKKLKNETAQDEYGNKLLAIHRARLHRVQRARRRHLVRPRRAAIPARR